MKIFTVTLLGAILLSANIKAQEVSTIPTETMDYVVATVNGNDIMFSEVQAMYDSNPQFKTMPIDMIFDRLLEDIVMTNIISVEAEKEKIEEDPEFKKEFEIIKKRLEVVFYLKKEIYDNITEEKLRTQYKKYIKANPAKDEVKARHILVADEATAKSIIEKLDKGADFAQIANDVSQDKGAFDGGDLGWFTKDTMVSEFADAAFNLKKGKYSEKPIQTQFGWHIIKVEDRRKAKQPEFEEVEDIVKMEYVEAETEKIMNNLKRKAKVKTYGIEGKK